MIKLGPTVNKSDIPSNLWVRCIYPKDVKSAHPVPCELTVKVIQQAGTPWEKRIPGVLGNNAWFEGMDRYGNPVYTEHEKLKAGHEIMWLANNNNGQSIVFAPQEKDYYLDSLHVMAISPSHDTWQPDKVIAMCFPFHSDRGEKSVSLYKETLDLVRQYNIDRHQLQVTTCPCDKKVFGAITGDLGTYLAIAGHMKHKNYYHYIHAAKFLQGIGFDIPEI